MVLENGMTNNSRPFDLMIKNGKVLTPHPEKPHGHEISSVDIGIRGGKIVELGSLDSSRSTEVIDATHLHVLPGLIDSQVHFREPGLTHKEDLESGSRSAALGGMTAFFEMPNTSPSTTTVAAVEDKIQRATGRSWVDFAFFVGASRENVDQLAELERHRGVVGVKIFMGSSTGSLLVEDEETLRRVLQAVNRRVAVHSEDELRMRERKHLALNSKDVHDHPHWRDAESALISTKRLIRLAEELGKKVHVLHVSTREEIDFLAQHKNTATIEVLPQHLTVWAPDCYDKWGTKAQQNPPIRTKEHHDALWRALQSDIVDVIGSDHAPHTLEEKAKPYPESPSGMPGVQTMLPLMLQHMHEGRLSLEHLCQLLSSRPAQIYGVRNKGAVRIGNDADFTLVDLGMKKTIRNADMASKTGWTLFDGWQVQGWPKMTILRGQKVMVDDEIQGKPQGQPVSFA
jgi:dihydroorotase